MEYNRQVEIIETVAESSEDCSSVNTSLYTKRPQLNIQSKSKTIRKQQKSKTNGESKSKKLIDLTKNSRKKCIVPAVKKMTKKAINFIVDYEEDYGLTSRQNNILAQIDQNFGEKNHNVVDEQNLDDMLLSEDELQQPLEKPQTVNRISPIGQIDQIKIDPFAPVKVESFDFTTDDAPIPENIDTMKSLNAFKIEGKILNHSIIVDNCERDSGLHSDFDLARCRSLFSKTFKIEEIDNLDEMLMGQEEKPIFASSSFIGSESTQPSLI